MLQMIEDSNINSGFFYPPLWKQRRNFIQDVLIRFNIETVLDYGCGESSVLSFLISPQSNNITKMAGIDIDLAVLQEAIERCTPYNTDYQRLRQRPLIIDIFHGSIGLVDDRFKNYQAIMCSEVIEHLYPDILHTFLDLTLGIYQPEILIVTTPNAEYNINFPNLKYRSDQPLFRHDDHKFEWTRKEFESWCKEGAKKYKYSVEFHGIGLLHGKYDQLNDGYCTQACVFIRQGTKGSQNQVHGMPHKLLKHIEFPYSKQKPLTEDEIRDKILDYVETLCRAEHYIRQDRNIGIESNEKDIQFDFDSTMDWNTMNIADYLSTSNENQKFTKKEWSPVIIKVSSIWEDSYIQDICKNRVELLHILSNFDINDYKLSGDDLIVYKSFEMDIDNDSVSTFCSDN